VSLLLLLPVLNLVAWWMIAYRDGLGPVRWLGAVLGTLFLLLSIAPAGILFGTMGGTMLAMAAGAGQAGSPEESAAMIAQIQRAMESGKTAGGPGASGRSPEVPDPWQAFGSEYTPDTGRCPPGTVKHGAQPPRGFGQWCARKGSEGEKRHGWTMTWHPNGVRATQGNYRDGLRTGTWIRWDDGGMKRAEALFEGGEQNGLMRRFDVYGESLQEVYFRDGQPVDMPGS